MKVSKTAIDRVFIIEPQVFEDARGYFFESWNKAKLKEQGIDYDLFRTTSRNPVSAPSAAFTFKRANLLRPNWCGFWKERCWTWRSICVPDLRLSAGTWRSNCRRKTKTTDDSARFGHGFSVLTPSAVFAYKCDNVYCKEAEGGLLYNDPALGIDWKIDTDKAVLSEKDRHNPLLKEITCI